MRGEFNGLQKKRFWILIHVDAEVMRGEMDSQSQTFTTLPLPHRDILCHFLIKSIQSYVIGLVKLQVSR
jgi:hypothetical protein